jgi:hypothetical protein
MNNIVLLRPLADAIASWALQKPIVLRVWIFGSRVRGNCHDQSDLDIAVELDRTAFKGSDSSHGMATWFLQTESWPREIQSLSPYRVDLQQFIPGRTATIEAAIAESSMLIYEKLS